MEKKKGKNLTLKASKGRGKRSEVEKKKLGEMGEAGAGRRELGGW